MASKDSRAGAAYHGFELLRQQDIPEMKTRARLLRHVKTGAELLSLENDDENKVFGITFRTPVADSTGVAHILEHAVLCGSRKYPLKDPFAQLLKGSLRTFLNAFTFPDKTCYPVASQNVQDFYNLIEVYLDTVLYPRLAPHTFQEQGWRYELHRPEDPLIFRGVVFNEMKGAYASPDNRLHDWAQRSLFPDTTYAFSSGGDPQHIPDLTYEQLKAFHQVYYHPSNARLYFYGDDDPEQRLRLLNDYLKDWEPHAADSAIRLQARWEEPRRAVRSYAVGEDDAAHKKAMVTVNWLLDEAADPQTALALHILDHLLIGTPASPLRKALIDSGLGEDIAGQGLLDYLRQTCFSTGLKGAAMEDADAVENLILRTLSSLAERGIDPDAVEAAFNTVEFRLRENNTGSFPRGLSLMLRALDTWLYDSDPLAPLAFEAPLAAIKARLAAEPYFENLIRRCLLDNTHRVTLLLRPDPEMNRREAEAEKARLEQARADMSPAEREAVVEDTRQLKRLQEMPDPAEALLALPMLRLSDLPKQNKIIPLAPLEQEGVRVLYHDLFTNGILYLDVGLDLHLLPQALLPYVPLFGKALLQNGTAREDFVQLTQRIGRETGGVRRQLFNSAIRGRQGGASRLFLRGKAMPSQAPNLLAILRDVLLEARLDNQERFRQIALEEKAHLEASLAPGGSSFVDARLRAHFDEASWAGEQMGGISYLFFLRALIPAVDADWPRVLADLEQIRRILLGSNALLCNVTLDGANWSRFVPQLNAFLAALTGGREPAAPATWSPPSVPRGEGMILPGQVNYVGKAANLYESGYELDGSSAVILNYLRTTWLWERVRKEGGAYGVSCSLDRLSGVFSYTSYRDPNLLETLDIYDRSSQFLREPTLNEGELARSIIGAIGDMDQYQLPDAKGFTSMVHYLTDQTQEFRQQMREEILSTTVADFAAFGDALERMNGNALVAVLGSQAAIDAANAGLGNGLHVFKVL